MPRLIPTAKRSITFFDTLFDTDTLQDQEPEISSCMEDLFSGRFIGGDPILTNLDMGGVLAADQSYHIEGVSYKAYFDTDTARAERLFALLETGLKLEVVVGCVPIIQGFGDWTHNTDAPRLVRNFSLPKIETRVHVPARQNVKVRARLSPALKEALIKFNRNKVLRVFLHGEQIRDCG